MRFRILLICFFVSGATGLVYEVLWLRILGLVFGHTVYATTTVLASVMGGLALGGVLFARRAARIGNLIRAYGALEIGIGLYCALIPGLLWLTSSLYVSLHRLLSYSYGAFSFVQFLVVFLLLLLPTTLMGGTLPILSQALVTQASKLGRTVGILYAVNTFGAVIGVVLAGYVLLPALGNRATTVIVIFGNVVVGLIAIAYSGGRRPPSEPVEATAGPAPVEAIRSLPNASGLCAKLTIAALGISGAVSMIYEVAWTRALALVIGSSTYAFTSMLAAFLIGIAAGSALYSWVFAARHHSPAAFGIIQVGIGLAVAASLFTFERAPELFLIGLNWSDSPTFVQVVQFVVSGSVLLPSTLLIGATFPCAVALVALRAARVGRDVGHIYAVNTLGGIAGTVLAGFVLVPALGVHTALKAGIVMNLLLGAVLITAWSRLRAAWRWGSLVAILVCAVGVFSFPSWDPRVMSSGPAIYGKRYLKMAGAEWNLTDTLRANRQKILFYRDGPTATVSVKRDLIDNHVSLQVNGKTDATVSPRGSGDMPTQIMLGHLAMLIHPSPKTILVIGLGSGITAGAVASYPIERLDIAEIEPAVVEASHFFSAANGDVLKDRRVRTVIADARNFLLTTSTRYDVLISEPSNPWIGGVASLFSIEFFQLVRDRLASGGIVLQWVHTYGLLPEDFQMLVKTFRVVFPATSIWNPTPGDFLLLGRTEAAPIDLELIKARFKTTSGIRHDLESIGIKTWPAVLGYFMLSEADAARFSEGGGLNTDDRLQLEFSAPRALYLDTTARNWRMARGFRTDDLPEVTPRSRGELNEAEIRYQIGAAYLSRGILEDALSQFLRALENDPRHTPSLVKASEASLKLGQPAQALDFARRALACQARNASALFVAGVASEELNVPKDAVAFLERAIALQPENSSIREALWRATARAQGK